MKAQDWTGKTWRERPMFTVWSSLLNLHLPDPELNTARWTLHQAFGDLPARVLTEREQRALEARDEILGGFQ